MKKFFAPTPKKITIFIILFVIIFCLPYIKASPAPGDEFVAPGRYPLIFVFLMSLVVIMDLFTGQFILRDIVFFLSFLAAFFLLYAAASALSLVFRPRPPAPDDPAPAPDKASSPPPDKLVVRLDDQNRP